MKFYELGTELLSDIHFSSQAPHLEWRLRAYPNGVNAGHIGHLSLFLLCRITNYNRGGGVVAEGPSRGVHADYKVYIPHVLLGTRRKPVLSSERTNLFVSESDESISGWEKWCSHDRLVPMLHRDGSLMLRAEVKYVVAATSSFITYCAVNEAGVDREKLMENCRAAFESMRLREVGADW